MKVYLILTVQLLFTSAFVAFCQFHKPTKNWIQTDGKYFYYVSCATFPITYMVLVVIFSNTIVRAWPWNFVCLSIFTMAFTYMLATIASFYDQMAVLIAGVITALVCLSVTVFAMQTKFDFAMSCADCVGVVWLFFLFGIAVMITFLVAPVDQRKAYILQCVYGALGALMFTILLRIDTHHIVGRRHVYPEFDPEDYICAATQHYLDVWWVSIYLLVNLLILMDRCLSCKKPKIWKL